MTDEFTIQCQSCGTYYNDLQDVCPYCGEPQPDLIEKPAPPEESLVDPLPEEMPQVDTHEVDPHPYADAEPPAEDYLPEEEDPFADDDIFAVAGQPDETALYSDEYPADFDDEYYLPQDQVGPDEFIAPDELFEDEESPAASRFSWRRILVGCLGLLLCIGLFYGGIGLLAVRRGLAERALITQTESQAHFQKGQEYLAADSIELAIAEFERALSLNPNYTEARQALREAQRIAQSQPTPTSETRSAAAGELLAKAETQISQQNWAEAIQTLSQVRDLDSNYRAERVSELLYTAHYQTGLQLMNPDQLKEALAAFEQALAERPNNPEALAKQATIQLYLDGLAAEQSDAAEAVAIFDQLHQEDSSFLDVTQRLQRAYELLGDELSANGEWCQAEVQYTEANTLRPDAVLVAKINKSEERCLNAQQSQTTPQPGSSSSTAGTPESSAPQPTATITATAASQPAAPGGGSIVLSAFNPNEARWEIVAVPVRGGGPEVLAVDATMPAVSPNGQLLLYHSEQVDSEGLHIVELAGGQDTRITQRRAHILPRWGGDNSRFIFVAQEAGTGRWQVYQGFADGKSDPIIIRDGRTPDWSPDGDTIAFQGTDAEGNNPGIYLAPFGGGESTRLTNHESDRSPDFSPNGSQLVFMSTRNGNWDIYTVSTAGSAPRQITGSPGNEGLPVWSPDGSQIAYVSDADGSWAVYIVSASGGTPAKITEWDGARQADWLLSQIGWIR